MKRIKASLNDNNVQFFCNPKKGVVVCKIESIILLPSVYGSYYRKKVKSIGKAVCGQEDVYSETKGKQIAESRAKVALYRGIKDTIVNIKHQLFNEEMNLVNQEERYQRLISKEKLHIEELAQ